MSQTPTAARPKMSGGSSHWYSFDGQAHHEVPKKDGTGNRPTNLGDARKLNLVPSVTGILRVLDKPALNRWKEEQVALAVLTTPRQPGELDDAFVHRVLHEEEQQEQEAQVARDKGIDIHDAIEGYFSGIEVPTEMEPWVRPVLDALMEFGQKASAEIILVGEDYAGQADLLQDCGEWWRLWDFKGTKNLPDPAKGAWLEHRLQLAAYGRAFQNKLRRAGQVKPILVGNIYISSVTAGQYVICEHEDWETAYAEGFAPLVKHWQFVNRYRPQNPNAPRNPVAAPADNVKLLQEIEALRAQVAVLKQNSVPAAPLPIAPPPEPPPEEDPAEPDVVPESVQALKKAGKKVAWGAGTLAPSNGPQGIPLPGSGAPGTPSPMVEKDIPLPPGTTAGQWIRDETGVPRWHPGRRA